MMVGLLWIVGSYAAAIAFVHWMYRISRGKRKRLTHYVLVTLNNQLQMEWYLRSLFFFSRMKGRSISVTIVDEGSTDETLDIARRISHEKDVFIRVEEGFEGFDSYMAEHMDEEVVVVKLSGVDDIRKAPLLLQ
ncbi:hypothetical protein [Paenibacillus hamazuiensis]|uniref:hypothetical protein n=1 Tax=Paenibacillus hamazuiensis TaxID=2936508 RepID=UPI00200F0B6B|nr:hypothetical protein [Paenibacillus hamazuiensis]